MYTIVYTETTEGKPQTKMIYTKAMLPTINSI